MGQIEYNIGKDNKMNIENPRAYGLQHCDNCDNLFTANTYYFPNLSKEKSDFALTCVGCLKKMQKRRNLIFVGDFYNGLNRRTNKS